MWAGDSKQSLAFKQRREDVMSRHSDKLHVLTTFQGQKLWLQVTKTTLWTKSRWAHSVFY